MSELRLTRQQLAALIPPHNPLVFGSVHNSAQRVTWTAILSQEDALNLDDDLDFTPFAPDSEQALGSAADLLTDPDPVEVFTALLFVAQHGSAADFDAAILTINRRTAQGAGSPVGGGPHVP